MTAKPNHPKRWVIGDIDLRAFPRTTVDGVVTHAPVSGRVVNTSEGGLCLQTREPLYVGERNVFHIQKGALRIRYAGQVRWCHFRDSVRLPSGDVVPVYRSGIALERLARRQS